MTLAQKIEKLQKRWEQINEAPPEYVTQQEMKQIEELKDKGEYISQEKLLEELGIEEDEMRGN